MVENILCTDDSLGAPEQFALPHVSVVACVELQEYISETVSLDLKHKFAAVASTPAKAEDEQLELRYQGLANQSVWAAEECTNSTTTASARTRDARAMV